MHSLAKWLGVGLLFFAPAPIMAQRALSIVAAAQVHATRPRFADDRVVNAQLSLPLRVYRSWTLGLELALSERLAIQATGGILSYGLALRQQLDYSRNRDENLSANSTVQNIFENSLLVRHYFPLVSEEPAHRWFTDVGMDVVYTANILGLPSIRFGSLSSAPVNGPGMAGYIIPSNSERYRLGLRVGAGHEWALAARHRLALEALLSYGLRDIERYEMHTEVWERGSNIDARKYDNTLATRLSFVGIQFRYSFQTTKPTDKGTGDQLEYYPTR